MVNLLEMCLPALNAVVDSDAQKFEWRSYVGDEVNDFGVAVVSYSEWKEVRGSVQPMTAQTKDILGLEPSERGINVWCSIDFKTLDVQEHCDQVRYRGVVYNCHSRTDWFGHDGWCNFNCVADKTTM